MRIGLPGEPADCPHSPPSVESQLRIGITLATCTGTRDSITGHTMSSCGSDWRHPGSRESLDPPEGPGPDHHLHSTPSVPNGTPTHDNGRQCPG